MKKKFILTCLSLGLFTSTTALANIAEVTSVSVPMGVGQRVTYAVVKYDEKLDASNINLADFKVKNRNIEEVYVASSSDIKSKATQGNYVIIKMNPEDADAWLITKENRQPPQAKYIPVEVTQVNAIVDAQGKSLAPTTKVATNQVNLVADDFAQLSFTDKDGTTINYNLYVPKNYNPQEQYPLVMFIHDAGVTSDYIKATLYQGNGATAWATPESQAKHPAFVLAPQFSDKIVTDGYEIPTKNINAIIDLITALSSQYNIDPARIYATGQSGGGMFEYALNITHPHFLAASYHVASQWEAKQVAPMAQNKMFIFISKDDPKAYPTWQQMIPVLEQAGAKIETAEVNGQDTTSQFNQAVNSLLAKGGNIHLMYVESNTLPAQVNATTQGPGTAHIGTWAISYDIPAIQDWLFSQRNPQPSLKK
ncbi:pyrroline-5-carboxylate reductase [Psittacicella gerlachiana]|uniref:Esterase Ig-like N-terminal domain-containing protein n=1 Tax=Psittacicella gerlachiana TaxID=2028574 RepID=A0A3A1YK47_9GAMM|nr:pyrroline-5-carboxylate reductase [Psittacicella gerlachiana]RIY38562.1 hypothetical protein CKF59_00550 [Psittacicella gerlachiana]